MSALTVGLILAFLFHALLLLVVVAVVLFFPKSFLSEPAKAVLNWLPPFLGGAALRDWSATAAEQLAQKRLADKRTGETVSRLAMEMEEAAMHAMLPLVEPADLERIVACPETGQGRVGVTAPEVLAIAAYIRKHKSRAEQKRIYELAVENAQKVGARSVGDLTPYPCALQGPDHVCCAFARRPLRCRPLHAISVANELARRGGPPAGSHPETPDEPRHEQIVAQGIEVGMTRALKSAGLDANIYELNSALATALQTPDAAECWARGDDVFRDALR
jgi:hypothetical protein